MSMNHTRAHGQPPQQPSTTTTGDPPTTDPHHQTCPLAPNTHLTLTTTPPCWEISESTPRSPSDSAESP